MKASKYREKTETELDTLLRERKDDLMHLRMQKATGVTDNCFAAKAARKDIARIKTIIKQRTMATEAGSAGEKS